MPGILIVTQGGIGRALVAGARRVLGKLPLAVKAVGVAHSESRAELTAAHRASGARIAKQRRRRSHRLRSFRGHAGQCRARDRRSHRRPLRVRRQSADAARIADRAIEFRPRTDAARRRRRPRRHRDARLRPAPRPAPRAPQTKMKKSESAAPCRAKICNDLGLHARAAAKLARLAGEFESQSPSRSSTSTASRCLAKTEADGKSITSLLMLAAAKGRTLEVRARGKDAAAAAAAIVRLVGDGFGENE